MTQTASTPDGAGPANERSAHRRRLRPQPGGRLPRRVSGPVAGRGAGATAGRAAIPNFEPRRRSAGRAAPRPGPSITTRAVRLVVALPDHPLLDRLVRGRAWIPVLGVLLAGIVAMQVEVLKLGASIGRSVQMTTELQSRNEMLRASVTSLSNPQRIESVAEATMGMVLPGPGAVAFITAQRSGQAAQAAANIHAPSPSAFVASQTAAGQSSATGAGASQVAAGQSSATGAGASQVVAGQSSATGAGASQVAAGQSTTAIGGGSSSGG